MFHLLSVSCAVVLMFLLSGCGRQETAGKTVLRFWHIMNYSGPQEVLEAAVGRFQAAHPEVEVEIEAMSNDDYKTKLALEMASGNEPDVFFNWGGGGQTGQYIDQGKVAELDAFANKNGWEGRFIGSAEALCRRNGKLYCAPLDLSVVVLWCNEALFKQHGVALPKTWEEFLAAGQAFKAAGMTPLSLGNYDAWPGAFYFCYLANRLGGTALFREAAAKSNGHDFADEAFVRAGDMLPELVKAGMFNADFAERREDEARKLFVRGRSAMYLGGSWLVGQLVKDPDNAEFLKNLVPITFPVLKDGKGEPTAMLGGVNCGFSVASRCQHPELAMELIGYLTDAATAEAWCGIGRIPACKVQEGWTAAFPAATKATFELLQASKELQPYYDQYLAAETTVEHKNTTRDLFKSRLTGREAAEKMKAK